MFSIGIDLGGTKAAGALVSAKGQVLKEIKIQLQINSQQSVTAKKKHLQTILVELTKVLATEGKIKAQICGIGLISAGPLNVDRGILIHPANLKGFGLYPIVKEFQEGLKKAGLKFPVFFQNDAIGAAFGERWVGGARGLETFAVVTVGTGIGTGVIFNGRPCQSEGMGSEFGHLIVDFNRAQISGVSFKKKESRRSALESMKRGTVEGLASGTALFERARNELDLEGENLEEILKFHKSALNPLFEEASYALAALFYNLSMGLHLQKILISGGMVKIQKRFLPKAIQIYQNWIKARNPAFYCPVQVAKLKDRAGLLGAACLPFTQ